MRLALPGETSPQETSNSRGTPKAPQRHQRGNSYYVLTAEHVVDKEAKYQVVTHDGKRYPVDYSTVQKLGVDLAVLQFQSQESYPVATLANYDLGIEEEPRVFLSGWPGLKLGEIGRPDPLFTAGRVFSKEWGAINAKDSYSLTEANGYELVYSNPTIGGMSGGPVLDARGRVIGIHAAAEGDIISRVQLGLSLGVPVRTFLSLASRRKIQPEWLKVESEVPPPLKRAVSPGRSMSPGSANRTTRGTSYSHKRGDTGERTAIREALFTAKKPSKGGKEKDWVNYGNQLWRLFEFEEAVAAFDEAIKLNPDFEQAWYARGLALDWQGEYQAAVASFDKATEINYSFYQAWRKRSEALYLLKRYSDYVLAYNNWGVTRSDLGDYKGAIEDMQKAAQIFCAGVLTAKKHGKTPEYFSSRYPRSPSHVGAMSLG